VIYFSSSPLPWCLCYGLAPVFFMSHHAVVDNMSRKDMDTAAELLASGFSRMVRPIKVAARAITEPSHALAAAGPALQRVSDVLTLGAGAAMMKKAYDGDIRGTHWGKLATGAWLANQGVKGISGRARSWLASKYPKKHVVPSSRFPSRSTFRRTNFVRGSFFSRPFWGPSRKRFSRRRRFFPRRYRY